MRGSSRSALVLLVWAGLRASAGHCGTSRRSPRPRLRSLLPRFSASTRSWGESLTLLLAYAFGALYWYAALRPLLGPPLALAAWAFGLVLR